MKRGEIYWIDADPNAVGSEYTKNRPGVIISNDMVNTHSGAVSVVYLTSKYRAYMPTHVYLGATRGGRFAGSTAKCEAVYTIDKSRVQSESAHDEVLPEGMERIEEAVAIGLGLTLPGEALTAEECDFSDQIGELIQRVEKIAPQGRKRTIKIEIVEE